MIKGNRNTDSTENKIILNAVVKLWPYCRYLRFAHDMDFFMEQGQDYLERVLLWEEVMNKYNYTFGISENSVSLV